MEELLYRYNPWWEKKYLLEGVFERKKILNFLIDDFASKQIVFLTGLRRVGKSTIMRLFIKFLIDNKHINPKSILYISLDDYLLAEKNILEIIDEFRKIHNISFNEKIYLFFDEISFQKDYEIQLKNIYDQQNVKIYASSSSATILKSKKPLLTGRNVIKEIMPLDFEEFLLFKDIVIKKSDNYLTEKYFEDYLKTGGMPEYVITGNIEYLKNLVDDILYKDIISFYNVKDAQLLKDYFLLLMERSGKIISINKIAKILDISPDTARRYLQMFENTYLIYLVHRFGKTNETILSPKKIYAADLGIRTLFTGFRDKGSLFENYVYLKIIDRQPKYIYQDKIELDFITKDKTLIEVKYNSVLTEKQEKLFKQFPAKNKIIIDEINGLENI